MIEPTKPTTLEDLLDIHAIQRLKYRYFRCIDRKRWDELADCFVPDARATYGGGSVKLEGRDSIIGFIVDSLGPTSILSSHHGAHPEIDLLGGCEARGVWALEDVIINQDFNVTIHGASFYEDRYVKSDGRWAIASTDYTRTYEEIWPRSSLVGLKLTADFWATGGRSSLT